MVQVSSSIPKHHFSRSINCRYNKTHILSHWNFMPSDQLQKYTLQYIHISWKELYFFQVFSLSQWAAPLLFPFIISIFLPISTLASLKPILHISARKIFEGDLWTSGKKKHALGAFDMKTICLFSPAPPPVEYHYFIPIFPFYFSLKIFFLCPLPQIFSLCYILVITFMCVS